MKISIPNPLDLFARKQVPTPALKVTTWPKPPAAPVEIVDKSSAALIQPETPPSVDLVPASLSVDDLREIAPNAAFHVLIPEHPTELLTPTALHDRIQETSPMATAATPIATAATKETVLQKVEGFLSKVGSFFKNDVAKGLGWAVQYAPSVATLATLFFPPAAAAASTTVTALTLVQNAVISVEQKFAASGVQTGTGPEKLAEVLSLTEGAATDLLKQAGVTVDTTFLTNIINVVVGILNIHPAPAA